MFIDIVHEVLGIHFQVGFNMEPTEETPLIEVLKLGLEKYLDSLQQISSQASKEFALENVYTLTFSSYFIQIKCLPCCTLLHIFFY